jgi:hypothetical protein
VAAPCRDHRRAADHAERTVTPPAVSAARGHRWYAHSCTLRGAAGRRRLPPGGGERRASPAVALSSESRATPKGGLCMIRPSRCICTVFAPVLKVSQGRVLTLAPAVQNGPDTRRLSTTRRRAGASLPAPALQRCRAHRAGPRRHRPSRTRRPLPGKCPEGLKRAAMPVDRALSLPPMKTTPGPHLLCGPVAFFGPRVGNALGLGPNLLGRAVDVGAFLACRRQLAEQVKACRRRPSNDTRQRFIRPALRLLLDHSPQLGRRSPHTCAGAPTARASGAGSRQFARGRSVE